MRLERNLFAACAATMILCSPAMAGGSSCCADLNGDGQVDAADLTILLAAWGTGGPGNCSGDAVVDAADLTILLAAWGPCPGGNPACPNPAHNCFTTGTPGCSDENCCNAVCTIDPFCCNNSWDTLCIGEAVDLCGNAACDTATNDCCDSAPTPGCNDASCCNSVCLVDPFCCSFSWDGICAGEAKSVCGFSCADSCGNSANDCCVASTTDSPFCNDAACCEAVCAADSFCCTTEWDQLCANAAETICTVCDNCGDSANDCCVASAAGTPFCNDAACCEAVCAGDPFCCATEWDQFCADDAAKLCVGCGGGEDSCGNSPNDCCVASTAGLPFCNDAACCEAVCANDPFCCNNQWDGLCANAAENICTACDNCGDSANDCCVASAAGTPFCNDAACCEAVCAADSFCCTTEWDQLCANAANTTCAGCTQASCGNSPNDCCAASANGTPFCNDAACCEAVCASDPFCCSNQWDGICAGEAGDICTPCGGFPVCGTSSNDCCNAAPPGVAGCNDASCCADVCAADPFCCSTRWDGLCVDGAETICGLPCSGFPQCPNPEHNCFTAGSAGCSDETCCNAVCAADPFCCNNSWDGVCVNGANDLCGNPVCPNPEHACNVTGGPGCSDETCCNEVCFLDPFCCTNSWDGICVNGAAANCGN